MRIALLGPLLGLCLIEGQKLKRIEKLDLKKTVRRELVGNHALGGQHD